MSVETLNIDNCCSVETTHKLETRLVNMPKMVSETIGQWLQRQRKRRELAQLDDRILEDIGLTQKEIEAEISKPFWVK
ncbi:DUF1127 domain-containing protein [Terasakiella sp. SH-1]|uniref:DUF1127 domain-containing protein n=1 Tax=Terasakiella sp. SH-1 TaxID=2560057 RepID=UPI00197E3D6B|nr:DUF1127 domain-containing protein [Terasakiella sp. SH-1]